MNRRLLFVVTVILACTGLFSASTVWAAAPPVRQEIGMYDTEFSSVTEADCRVCHHTGVNDRHHNLVLDPSGNYTCIGCHGIDFVLERNCTTTGCHGSSSSPHHSTGEATGGDCVFCHGDLVDNGHASGGQPLPDYDPSLVTPYPSEGDGLPLNTEGNGAGACDYCHDEDPTAVPEIFDNHDLHHSTDLGNCSWCHSLLVDGKPAGPGGEQIRRCESCHGRDSLHNIQADSDGNGIVVGGEAAGYGHVGRDAGPGDSDCWGCHGFAAAITAAVAPGSGPIIPTLYSSDVAVIRAGTDTMVVVTGAAFTNTLGGTLYESDVRLTAADGSSVTLTPDIIVDEGNLAVTIPGDTAPGNYNIQVVKDDFASNPAVIAIIPGVSIRAVTFHDTVTILGSGFGGHLEGSGTLVTGEVTTKSGKKNDEATSTVEATIVSWTDTKIVADFGAIPDELTVNSVFGSATSEVESSKVNKRNGKGRRGRRRSRR